MPNEKPTPAYSAKAYEKEFKGLKAEGDRLICTPCGKIISTDLRSHAIQHLEGSKHKLLAGLTKNEGKQSYLTDAGPSSASCQFPTDFCAALIGANIPFYELENHVFRGFLTKYSQQNIPRESFY